MSQFFKQPLFILEMANNHMGSLDHGLFMIDEFEKITREFPFQFAFKFQFRDLDTFIHPDYKTKMELKYIKRFSETRLSDEQFLQLKKATEEHGFLTICTPFDEISAQKVEDWKFDILKIASCSFNDWPLLEKIVTLSRPIIASTSAATLEQIGNVVTFLKNRSKQLALMHCTGEYPTKRENLQLNQIDLLRHRHPDVPIGYSTHEEPHNFDSIFMSVAKGAMIFEKHVAIETDKYKKNEYSATPDQIYQWLSKAKIAFETCGVVGRRSIPSEKEIADLRQFKRGVFVSRDIKKGERLDESNTFLAFPNQEGQLVANDLSKYIDYYSREDLKAKAPVSLVKLKVENKREKIFQIVKASKSLLDQANTVIPGMAMLDVSHHYGLEKFSEYGCVLITVINREYCKKLILVFSGQQHPEQHHKQKEETFVVLYGEVLLGLDGVERLCKRGDVVTINPGVKHYFSSKTGAVIEEISSTHFKDDSYYTDPKIAQNKDRKTALSYWMDNQ